MKIITASLLNELAAKAGSSPRHRANFNLHQSSNDSIQRFFIAAKMASYFRPHRHRSTFELAILLQGNFDLLLFDENAVVTDRISLGADSANRGFELPPDVWHAWIPLVEDSIFMEVKAGPYDPKSVDFADWSPPEGDARVADFLSNMRGIAVGSRCL